MENEVKEEAAVEAARKGVGGCGKEEERGGEKMYSQRERRKKAHRPSSYTHVFARIVCLCCSRSSMYSSRSSGRV